MSGRWGDRPLGRGDGGYCNLKSVWLFLPFCRARARQHRTQEKQRQYRLPYSRSSTNFRLLDQFASHLHSASIARRIHSFPVPPHSSRGTLLWYGSTPMDRRVDIVLLLGRGQALALSASRKGALLACFSVSRFMSPTGCPAELSARKARTPAVLRSRTNSPGGLCRNRACRRSPRMETGRHPFELLVMLLRTAVPQKGTLKIPNNLLEKGRKLSQLLLLFLGK
jgi:hypothetical protein